MLIEQRSKLAHSLLCPICLCPFEKVPKILPQCGHSFCASCLEQWMLASGCVETGRLTCPLCKSQTRLNLSRDLLLYFRISGFMDGDDREYEAECIVNYLVEKVLPESPILSNLTKMMRKRRRSSIFSKKPSERKTTMALNSLSDLLRCPVCDEEFDDEKEAARPRMLPPCMHSVCMRCLRHSYKRSDREFGFISCPLCWSVYKFRVHENEEIDSKVGDDEHCAKKILDTSVSFHKHTRGPSEDDLASYLPFDYALSWLLDNAHVIRKELLTVEA